MKNKTLTLSIISLVILSFSFILFTEKAVPFIQDCSLWIRDIFGPYYLFFGLLTVVFLVYISFSKYGNIRLGHQNSRPEYSTLSWLSMLFSAGMGAGIILRAVQEPVFMFLNPPIQTNQSNSIKALEFTFYQWGITPWAMYGIVGLIIAYNIYNKKNNILISNSLHLKKNRAIIDITVIISTCFGIVAAINLGVTQISEGIQYTSNTILPSFKTMIVLLLIIFSLSLTSALMGVNKGIKWISNFNILLTFCILLFVLFNGNTASILKELWWSTFHYVVDFIPMSLAVFKFNPGKDFLSDWTYYYWAFWIAWAPFTGVFIARISKGRSIKQFVWAILTLPCLGTFLWFSTFGTESFQILSNTPPIESSFNNVYQSIFRFMDFYPFSNWTNPIIIILLITFLITSVDSSIYVLSMFTEKGSINPSKKHRMIWGILLPFFAFAFLYLSYSKSTLPILPTISKTLIISSLPLSFIILAMLIQFYRKIKQNTTDHNRK